MTRVGNWTLERPAGGVSRLEVLGFRPFLSEMRAETSSFQASRV